MILISGYLKWHMFSLSEVYFNYLSLKREINFFEISFIK